MPLGQPPRDGQVYVTLAQVLGLRDAAADEAVHHAIVEAGQQLGGQAVLHEQLVVLGLALAVDDQVGAVAVGAQQDGLAVDLVLGQARLLVDGLEQGVGDAIGKADKVDVFGGPLRAQVQDEAAG